MLALRRSLKSPLNGRFGKKKCRPLLTYACLGLETSVGSDFGGFRPSAPSGVRKKRLEARGVGSEIGSKGGESSNF